MLFDEEENQNDAPGELTFEQALGQLEQLVNAMENGKQPLEQLISDFEKGTVLIKQCRQKLNKLEQKIEILSSDDNKQGNWTPFQA